MGNVGMVQCIRHTPRGSPFLSPFAWPDRISLTSHSHTPQLEGLVESIRGHLQSAEAALGARIRELEGRVSQ